MESNICGATLPLDFVGSDYDPELDYIRLKGQILRIWETMQYGDWYTLAELETRTHSPQASISAQLRHLRKEKFGYHTINKRRRGDKTAGLFEYQLVINKFAKMKIKQLP